MNRRHLLAVDNAGMFLYGISAMLIGPTLPGMIERFSLSLEQGGLIGSVQNAGGLIASLVALAVADSLRAARTSVVAFAAIGVSLLVIGIAPSYAWLLAAFAVSGLSIRAFDVMLNAHAGRNAHESQGRSLSVLHMFFGIGAFVGPIAARAIMGVGVSWNGVYASIGIFYLVVIASTAAWLRAYVRDDAAPRASRDVADPIASPGDGRGSLRMVVLLGVALTVYAVHQVGVSTWLPYFLERGRGAGADLASFGLSAYWVGIIAGRYASSRVVERIGAPLLLVAGSLVAAGATLLGAIVTSVPIAILCFALAGMASGATIPLVYSVVFARLPARVARVTAFMSVLMLAGRLVGPWLLGKVAQTSTLQTAMLVPAFALAITSLLVVAAVPLRASPRQA